MCTLPPGEEGPREEGAGDAAVALVTALAAEGWEEGCGAASERTSSPLPPSLSTRAKLESGLSQAPSVPKPATDEAEAADPALRPAAAPAAVPADPVSVPRDPVLGPGDEPADPAASDCAAASAAACCCAVSAADSCASTSRRANAHSVLDTSCVPSNCGGISYVDGTPFWRAMKRPKYWLAPEHTTKFAAF